ncbi:MAG: hypothetical protein AVDCRST_MAG80-303 [uncultured Rubrobacteraceae bacterium]|uniref:Uncharacterized protein n=1 Tax=uncultured Rubrobacteraceae bacterium TaxID=349277 RepID=A0A6J4PVY0_9ACTN|nr:MAG: hypothetical protein AVDCRST_MAG80-303 [uncultured Rubrobacteraceae bacterium]
MPNHIMTPHTAGTTLDAQKHYADDTQRCLQAYFAGEQIEDDHLIVDGGEIVSSIYKAIYGQIKPIVEVQGGALRGPGSALFRECLVQVFRPHPS